ncbi:MAG: hypothetical protein QGD92_08265 [Gammaproteobacteria bacterium]|nr:hypothetical protein [Gammaproteobacteria bacterium]
MFGHNHTVITKLEDSNYEQVCVAFGGAGERADTIAEIKDALRRALEAARETRVPPCINVSIDPEVIEPSMGIMMGGGDDAGEPKSETAVPYYENLPE